jgi:hypothetical protein
MVRNFVAFGVLAVAGALFCLPEPALAAGGMRGGMPGFRGAAVMHAPRMMFRPAHRTIAPRSVIPRSPRAFGTVKPSTPFGTVKASRPFGTVGPAPRVPRFARVGLSHPRSHLTRRHHRGHYFGWSFPVTYGDDAGYIGIPYDPTEAVPVYGPAPAEESDQEIAPQPAPRASATRDENGNACSSEKVTVPAAEGERQITVVRC